MASVQKRSLDFSKFPSWFKPEPGFRFEDGGGDRCIVIGEGGWRETETVPLMVGDNRIGNVDHLVMHPWTLVIAYHYKGEWHMADAFTYYKDTDPTWEKFTEGWE